MQALKLLGPGHILAVGAARLLPTSLLAADGCVPAYTMLTIDVGEEANATPLAVQRLHGAKVCTQRTRADGACSIHALFGELL